MNSNRVWFAHSWGMVALGFFLLLFGIQMLFHLTFTGEDVVLGLLALGGGILILLGI